MNILETSSQEVDDVTRKKEKNFGRLRNSKSRKVWCSFWPAGIPGGDFEQNFRKT